MAFDKQRVSTTGGNCILDSENKVYVNLGQKSVRKKARDIKRTFASTDAVWLIFVKLIPRHTT